MNDYKKIETKLWSEVSMLTSGVLTSLIYGLLSEATYTLDIEGKQYEIVSTGMSTWCAFGLVVITFLSLWVLISVLIPWLLRIKQRFTYDKVKKITAKELIKTLDEAKASIKELYPVFCTENSNDQDANLIKLQSRDLAKTILLLHRKFLPQNKKIRKTIETYFRRHEHSSVITIDQKISCYELLSAVALLKSMVAGTKSIVCGDKLLEKDCTEMEKALEDLEKLAGRIR